MEGFRWDSIRHPRGPLPSGAYWWRRGVALLVVVAVIVVLVAVVGRGGSGGNHQAITTSPSSSTTPSTADSSSTVSPTASPTTTATGAAGATPTASGTATTASTTAASATSGTITQCATDALSLKVTTSADDYPAGTAPKFTAVLSTTGPSCTAPAPVVFTVVSGSDRIWSNVDCAKSTSGPVTTLGDKGGASSVRSWQRDRSAPGCKKVYGSSTAAAGTYRVTASWAGVTSNEAVFRLH